MSTVTDILTEDAFKAHVAALPPQCLLICSFHAPWAAPCAQMQVVLDTLAASYPATQPPSTSWVRINAEDLPDVSETYDVTAVPYLVLVRDNHVLDAVSGSNAVKVREAIEKHAAAGASAPPAHAAVVAPADLPSTATAAAPVAPTPPAPEAPRELTEDELARQKEELHARLSQLVQAAPVMLFMKGTPSAPQCGFSRQLVGLLREHGVKYGFFNILADDDVRQGLKEFADWPTYPQLWLEGDLIGGLDIFKEELTNNPDFLDKYSIKKTPAAA